jgi:hypothetical protein
VVRSWAAASVFLEGGRSDTEGVRPTAEQAKAEVVVVSKEESTIASANSSACSVATSVTIDPPNPPPVIRAAAALVYLGGLLSLLILALNWLIFAALATRATLNGSGFDYPGCLAASRRLAAWVTR